MRCTWFEVIELVSGAEPACLTLSFFSFFKETIDQILSITTLVTLGVGVFSFVRQSRQDRERKRREAFQHGLELLTSPSEISQAAGIAALQDLCLQAKIYRRQIALVMRQFISEQSEATRTAMQKRGDAYQVERPPPSSGVLKLAVASLGDIKGRDEWPSGLGRPLEGGRPKLQISGLALDVAQIFPSRFDDIDFHSFRADRVYFSGCSFTSCSFENLRVRTRIFFIDCAFRDVTIDINQFTGDARKSLSIDEIAPALVFVGKTTITSLTVNAAPFEPTIYPDTKTAIRNLGIEEQAELSENR